MEVPGTSSERLIDQRVRNRIIECLELAASLTKQAEVGPAFIVNLWADWVHEPIDVQYPSPVFTDAERQAIHSVNAAFEEAQSASSSDVPPGDELALPAWAEISAAAQAALVVFVQRGRLPEDRVAT